MFSVLRDFGDGVRIMLEVDSTHYGPLLLPKDAIYRLVCHAMLERLPSEAIQDVWETMYDAWEWHRRPALPAAKIESPPFVLNQIFEPVEEKPFSLDEE